jgi:hypothetical protein
MTDTAPIVAELKRIAESLDQIAALLAAPAALRSTGLTDILSAAGGPLTVPPQADADGWIEWTGGKHDEAFTAESVPPGLHDTLVYVRFRDGEEVKEPYAARLYDWRNTDSGWNITAYRIHKDQDR